jgi:hypothetical protein
VCDDDAAAPETREGDEPAFVAEITELSARIREIDERLASRRALGGRGRYPLDSIQVMA